MRKTWVLATYIADNSNLGDRVENIKPDANILSTISDRSSNLAHKLVRVDTNLKNVVGESKEWRQRKCCDENCDEAKLKNCEI